jgi:hypothetical protein
MVTIQGLQMVKRTMLVPVILVMGITGLAAGAEPPVADVNAPQTLEYLG